MSESSFLAAATELHDVSVDLRAEVAGLADQLDVLEAGFAVFIAAVGADALYLMVRALESLRMAALNPAGRDVNFGVALNAAASFHAGQIGELQNCATQQDAIETIEARIREASGVV